MRDAQVLAAGVVERVLAGRNLDVELADLWRRQASLTGAPRALVQDLCYGALRHLGVLDALLTPLLNKPLRDEIGRAHV